MTILLVAIMTAPLWGGFLAMAWQARKLVRAIRAAAVVSARTAKER